MSGYLLDEKVVALVPDASRRSLHVLPVPAGPPIVPHQSVRRGRPAFFLAPNVLGRDRQTAAEAKLALGPSERTATNERPV